MEYTAGSIKNTEFFTTTELAKKLKMNVQVITRKVQSGEIHAYKIGKEWRIPEPSVFNWLQGNVNSKSATNIKNKTIKPAVDSSTIKPAHTEREKQSSNIKSRHLLEYILAQFEPNQIYLEKDVDRIISRFHRDYSTVRREFLSERMLEQVNGKYRRRAGYSLSG